MYVFQDAGLCNKQENLRTLWLFDGAEICQSDPLTLWACSHCFATDSRNTARVQGDSQCLSVVCVSNEIKGGKYPESRPSATIQEKCVSMKDDTF